MKITMLLIALASSIATLFTGALVPATLQGESPARAVAQLIANRPPEPDVISPELAKTELQAENASEHTSTEGEAATETVDKDAANEDTEAATAGTKTSPADNEYITTEGNDDVTAEVTAAVEEEIEIEVFETENIITQSISVEDNTVEDITVTPIARTVSSTEEALAWDIIEVTNAYRVANGLAPLAGSVGGNAQGHANWMASNQILQHTSDPNVGENIAKIWTPNLTGPYVVSKWQESPGHNRNLLNPSYRTIQVWCTDAADGYSYCTQQFTY